jgi:hypothetical protein
MQRKGKKFVKTLRFYSTDDPSGRQTSLTEAYTNWIPQYDKCFSISGDYIEKQLKYVLIFCRQNFFLVACFVNSSLEVAS